MICGRCCAVRPRTGTADYGGHKRTKSSKLHAAVDTLGHLLASRATPVNAQERAQVGELADAVQAATRTTVELAHRGYTGDDPTEEAKMGFALLPRPWVVERSFAWATRFRRLAKDYERLPETAAGLHFVAFACLMLHKLVLLPHASP